MMVTCQVEGVLQEDWCNINAVLNMLLYAVKSFLFVFVFVFLQVQLVAFKYFTFLCKKK